MFLDALASVLRSRGHDVTATTQDLSVAVEIVGREHPDVLMLDVWFSAGSGVETAAAVRRSNPSTAILLLTAAADEQVWSAFDNHLIDGVVNKVCGIETIDGAIRRVQQGDRVVEGWRRHRVVQQTPSQKLAAALTTREHEVLDLMVHGGSTTAMAATLGVSEHTVRTHVQNVLRKLGVHGRGKAARVAIDMGIVGQRTHLAAASGGSG
jgi:DNA-binding NarL/FixJ family response regulator